MRKVLILAALALSMHSCKTHKVIPPVPYTLCYSIDYSILTSDGYFVTESNSVSFDYDAISSIYMEVHSGWIKLTKEERNQIRDEDTLGEDCYYATDGSTQKLKSPYKYKYVKPDPETAMSELKKYMKAQGADGILNLKLKHEIKNGEIPSSTPYDEYISITGMLFKRK